LCAMLFVCVAFVSRSTAQTRVENYKVETGTDFSWDYWQGEYLGWGYDDLMYTKLPFDFTYDGILYPAGSTLAISPNGWVSFNENADPYDYGNLTNGNYPNTIYVLGMDLNLWGSMYAWNDNGKLNLTWEYAEDAWGYGYWNYFQVVLDSKDNSISMSYYGNCWWMHPYGEAVAVGLNGNNGGEGFSYNIYSMDPWSPCENIKFRAPKPDKPALTLSMNTLNYGNVGLGLTKTLCVTVTNTGEYGEPGGAKNPLTFNPAIITGSVSEYSVASSPATSLDIGETADYCVQFMPNAPNTRTGNLTVITNAGNGSVALTGNGVAAAMSIEQQYLFRKSRTKLASYRDESFWIKSTGLAPLKITSALISGEYPEQYSIVAMPTVIAPGDSGKVTIRYSPRYEGLKTAVLTITTTAYGKNTHVVQLFGMGTLQRMVITPSSIGTDSVGMGEEKIYTIRLMNNGSDTVRILRDFFSSADRDFTYTSINSPALPNTAIAPDQFREVQVRFAPISRGFRQARLRIETDIPLTMEASPRDTSKFDIDITGIGVPYGLMSVEGDAMFDSALIGEEICRTVEIWNNGELELTVTSADLTGTDTKDFEITGVSFPLTIQPMSKVDAQVCATPTERGPRTASLSVKGTSNDKTTTIEIPLEVFGLLACSSPDKNVAFGSDIVRVGSMKTEQITISNCGDVAATFTASINGAAYSITGPQTTGLIAPGASHVYEVQFNASTMSLQQGTMTVAASTPAIADIVIDLAGTGGNSILAATNTNVASPGTPVDFDVTVTNTGNMDWSIGTPVVDGAEFTLRTSPTSIMANSGTGTFAFTYTPATGGTHTANVTFPNSDNTTFSFSVNGTQASVGMMAMNGYELRQNFPNPFAGTSSIAFTMAEAGNAKLVLTDITGNTVAVIANGFFGKGENTVMYDASSVSSGNYFYELTVGETRLQRAMTIRK
jgi:hypothetical protein